MPINLADGFVARARENPERAAFVLGGKILSYQALDRESERWLGYLHELFGPSTAPEKNTPTRREYAIPERLVAWEGPNHTHLPALYLACLRSGCCLVLLDPAWPTEHRAAICRTLGLQHRVTVSTDPGLCRVQSGSGVLADPFLLGFTSGSSGFPKAFVRTQQSWLSTFGSARREFDDAASGRVLAPGPLSHGLSFYAMAETLEAGGTFYCQESFDPLLSVSLLQEQKITVLVVVPTMLVAMLNISVAKSADRAPGPFRVLSAGAKLAPSVHAALTALWPGVRTSEYYGASELSFVSVAHADENAPVDSVGRVFSGVSISIRDARGEPLPRGETGTVWASSEMLAQGIAELDNPASNRALQPVAQREADGLCWATVGDIGKLDARGYLYLQDRVDNMIISGGLNVSPTAVESVLTNHPCIVDSAVLGMPDDYWGERVSAVVQLAPEARLSIGELYSYCKLNLAAEQIPKQVFTTTGWPMTSSGKLARSQLRDLLQNQPELFGQLGA